MAKSPADAPTPLPRGTRRSALVAALLAAPAYGAVEFEPEISIGVARTDNLTLVSENEQSETIYQLMPGFELSQESARLTSDVAYSAEAFYYDELSDSEAYQQLDANVRTELDPENFFFDFGASRSQSIRDPLAPIPRSNLPISGNRVDRDELYAGPAFEYALGSSATARGSYRHSRVRYDDDVPFGGTGGSLRDNYDSDTFDLSFDNYRRERGFTWALRYNAQQTDYGVFEPWEYQRASAELGAWVGEGLRLFVSGGQESAWDQPFDSSLEDTFWEAGFSKSVAERLTAEVAVGERTFGSSKRASLDFSFRNGSTGLSYSETPTTQGRNPYERGGLRAPSEPEDFLTRPGLADRYISKRAEWNGTLELGQTNFSLRLFDETREDRSAIDGTPLPEEAQRGAYFSASRELGVHTEISFDARRVRREFAPDTERDLTTVSVNASYELGTRTQLSLSYEHSEEDSGSASGGGFGAYEANLISLLLTRTF